MTYYPLDDGPIAEIAAPIIQINTGCVWYEDYDGDIREIREGDEDRWDESLVLTNFIMVPGDTVIEPSHYGSSQ